MENLVRLRDALFDGTYHPNRGTAHVIFDPVQREIFAAPYVDRVAHHWIVNTMVNYVDKRLNYESCSCRVGKGTSFGIERLHHHIQAVSNNYSRPTYVVKMDISGYFMHIRRDVLYEQMAWWLDRIFEDDKGKRYEIIKHAVHEIIFDNPVEGVKIQGSYEDWRGLPDDKSLFTAAPNCGLVIGNLTSQFSSNIYLDPLDRFITMELGYKHYGRYVDDFYVVVAEEELPKIERDMPAIEAFLNGYGLNMNQKKTRKIISSDGVPFLGMVVRDADILPGKRLVHNFNRSADKLVAGTKDVNSIVSYLGMIKNYNGKKIAEKIFERMGWDLEW